MSSTAYLPVHCRRCQRVRLQPVQSGALPLCLSCEAPATVAPGQSYTEKDVELFDRIDLAVRSVGLQRNAARRLVGALGDSSLAPLEASRVLLQVIDIVPGLHFLLGALSLEKPRGLSRSDPTRASGMVATSVRARLRELDSERPQETV